MYRCAALVLILPCGFAQAQVLNPSFEANAGGSLQQWLSTCTQIDTIHDAAPGWGEWCSRLPNENSQGGCWTVYLYQHLSGVQNGDLLTFSGWLKHQIIDGTPAVQMGIHAAHIDSAGVFHLDQSAYSNDTIWTHLQFDHLYSGYLLPSDTPIVLLTGGQSLLPTFYGYALYDGIEVFDPLATGTVPSGTDGRVRPFPVPCDRALELSRTDPLESVWITDEFGRIVLHPTQVVSSSPWQFDTASLSSGSYSVQVRSSGSHRAYKIIVQH